MGWPRRRLREMVDVTSPAAPVVVTVSSALHGDRLWRRVGDAGRPAGPRSWQLVEWSTACVVCGQPFSIKARSTATPTTSNSFTVTTCRTHRMSRQDIARLRRAGARKRAAVFSEIRARKLAEG
jgi:hypothetical protein